jgi:outer membrane protein assembly factor BamB
VVALEPGTLRVKDFFTPGKQPFNSSPVVFSHGTRELIAVSNSDGRIYLLDRESPGGADHKTPLAVSQKYTDFDTDFSPGALAAFQDTSGTNWVLAPSKSGIVAFRVVDQSGKPGLIQGWTSRAMTSPLTPVILNGVVFAASGGEFHSADLNISAGQRTQRSVPAVLYALEGSTGRELWNSGTSISSFAPASGGLSASVSQVYLPTYDNTVYTFSLISERE